MTDIVARPEAAVSAAPNPADCFFF